MRQQSLSPTSSATVRAASSFSGRQANAPHCRAKTTERSSIAFAKRWRSGFRSSSVPRRSAGTRFHARLTFAQEQGADGTLLGLPMWQPCTTDMAVKFYADVSGAFPKLPIMVYANARAFRFSFPPEFWARVADEAPTVIAAKSSHARNLKENQQATSTPYTSCRPT